MAVSRFTLVDDVWSTDLPIFKPRERERERAFFYTARCFLHPPRKSSRDSAASVHIRACALFPAAISEYLYWRFLCVCFLVIFFPVYCALFFFGDVESFSQLLFLENICEFFRMLRNAYFGEVIHTLWYLRSISWSLSKTLAHIYITLWLKIYKFDIIKRIYTKNVIHIQNNDENKEQINIYYPYLL